MAEAKKAELTYDSNPFTLAFAALGNLFNKNVVWAIVIIGLGILGFFGQVAQSFVPAGDYDESGYTEKADGDISPMYEGLGDPENTAAIAVFVSIVVLVVAVIVLVSSVVGSFIQGMFVYVALESEKGKSVSFGEAFNAVYKRFWRLFLAGLLAGLKIFAWSLLLIVPGIIAGLRYALLPYVIMSAPESEKGVKASHDTVKSIVSKRLWEVFGVATVGAIIPIIGGLLTLSGNAALHNQLQAYNGKEKPQIHWLNYLGLMLLGLLMLLIFGFVVLLITVFSFS